MRVFAISDIHVDYIENAEWLSHISRHDYLDDVLILAGDLTDVPDLLRKSFEQLVIRFKQVLFVPGNHELWIYRSTQKSSFEKFEQIKVIAKECGVSMQPFHAGEVSIVPLLGWYDYSFGQPKEDLYKMWMDYRACEWEDNDMCSVTDYFMKLNEPYLNVKNKVLISFSHFLPRIDLMPAYIPPVHRLLYPVLGSLEIDKQVRRLQSDIHVYGHSHVNRHINKEGVEYINNAFGNPSETRISSKQLLCIHDG